MLLRRIGALFGLLVLTLGLSACEGEGDAEGEDTGEKGEIFTKIAHEGGLHYREEYIHNETGCHYLRARGGESDSFIQMFIEEDGNTIPYCTKEEK